MCKLGRKLCMGLMFCFATVAQAQSFVKAENDTTVIAEYLDGRVWAYRQLGDVLVGMTNYMVKDYGKFYQVAFYIKNLGDKAITFNPEEIFSVLHNRKGELEVLKVHSYENYMKKVNRSQAWTMALLEVSAGLSAGFAGYQTSQTTVYQPGKAPYTQRTTSYNYAAASAANSLSQLQIMEYAKMMRDDKHIISKGYLKMTTMHPDESIFGYVNIEREKGELMTVGVYIDGHKYLFDWDVSMKKKRR